MRLSAAEYDRLTENARAAVDHDRKHEEAVAAWVDGLELSPGVLSLCRARAVPKPVRTTALRVWISRALAIACGNGRNVPGGDGGPGGPGGPTGGTPAAGRGGAMLAIAA